MEVLMMVLSLSFQKVSLAGVQTANQIPNPNVLQWFVDCTVEGPQLSVLSLGRTGNDDNVRTAPGQQ